jgi:hypothetical protein
MTAKSRAALLAALALARPAAAADLSSVDRAIKKEPAYQTKAPRYCLLIFGPEAKDRVWLVHDGDTLYVDRNGDGDLTGPGNRVAAKGNKDYPSGDTREFDAGELRVGGRVHKGLAVWAVPLAELPDEVKNRPNAKAALAADPKARVYRVSADVDWPGLKGIGVGGRVVQMAGPSDLDGALLLAPKPADAPVVHLGGPLEISFYDERPALRLGRGVDAVLVVGTRGRGPGTFAMLAYEDTIPAGAAPKAEVTFPPAKEGGPPVRELYELKERC